MEGGFATSKLIMKDDSSNCNTIVDNGKEIVTRNRWPTMQNNQGWPDGVVQLTRPEYAVGQGDT